MNRPKPNRVDPIADALASIDAPPEELDAALRRQLGGADPRSALELHVSAVADDLRREAPEAMNGAPPRSPVPSDDASALAAHLREKHRTRATEPAYHARRLAESRRALARIARVDRFTAERLAAGDDPSEATLRVLGFVRAAWSEVPGGMDGAPPEPRVPAPIVDESAEWSVTPVDFNPPPPPFPETLRESVAAHVAHSGRLRARQSNAGREPGPMLPPTPTPLSVILAEFNVSDRTIRNLVADKKLRDLRPEPHAENAPLVIDRNQLVSLGRYPRRPDADARLAALGIGAAPNRR